MENAHFNLETNWLLNISNYTYVCDIIQFVQIIVITEYKLDVCHLHILCLVLGLCIYMVT